jgi:hypothetical protein
MYTHRFSGCERAQLSVFSNRQKLKVICRWADETFASRLKHVRDDVAQVAWS